MSKAGGDASPAPEGEPARRVGIEFRKFYRNRLESGFIKEYLSGCHVLDVGFRGGDPETVPITDQAIGVDLDYPEYDGTRLPFADGSQDAVLASHVLEHVWNFQIVLADWYRVLRVGGYLVIFVPHRYLYERRPDLPSRWNGDHKRFYTPASLLAEIEESLPVNGFRVRHLADNDIGFRYDRDPAQTPAGGYEIELVIQKIEPAAYTDQLEYSEEMQRVVDALDALIYRVIANQLRAGGASSAAEKLILTLRYVTPWVRVCRRFTRDGAPELDGERAEESALKSAMAGLLACVEVDEAYYLGTYPELKVALDEGRIRSAATHWRLHGYFEGRLHRQGCD